MSVLQSALSVLFISIAANGLRGLALLAAVAVTAAIIAWRYSTWWCFWTGQQTTPILPLRLQHVYQENIQVLNLQKVGG